MSENISLKMGVKFAASLNMGKNVCQVIYIETRSTEGAVRGPQYGPFSSIQPEKRSFEGCIEGFGPY